MKLLEKNNINNITSSSLLLTGTWWWNFIQTKLVNLAGNLVKSYEMEFDRLGENINVQFLWTSFFKRTVFGESEEENVKNQWPKRAYPTSLIRRTGEFNWDLFLTKNTTKTRRNLIHW